MPPPTLWLDDESPVLLGVEHEYNWCGPDGYESCTCSECWPDGPPEDYCTPGFDWDDLDALLPEGWDAGEEHTGAEVRSAPTRDIRQLVRVFSAVETQIGDAGHSNCGLHVHVNANPLHGPAVNPQRFLSNWMAYREEFLYPHVPGGLDDRHQSDWCRPQDCTDLAEALEPRGFHELRYNELNPTSLSKFGTVEVRLAGATGDILGEFEDWLRRIAGLAAISLYINDESPSLVYAQCIGSFSPMSSRPANTLGNYVRLCGEAPILETT